MWLLSEGYSLRGLVDWSDLHGHPADKRTALAEEILEAEVMVECNRYV
jgi:hypothetical protein